MIKCENCSYGALKRGTLTAGGRNQVVVECKKEGVTFEIELNSNSKVICEEVK